MTTISIDDIRKCLSEQFYSYNRDDHSILISLLNLPEQLKQWNKCDTDQPIDELIKEVKSCLKKRYNTDLSEYTKVPCLTLELKLTELGFETDESEEFKFYEKDIETVYRLTLEETEQFLFGF